MADLLTEFLREAAGQPFVFGEWDCSIWLANWVQRVTGRDPAAHLRGTYSDEAGWRALVAEAGGLSALVGAVFIKAGLVQIPTDEAIPGNVAVVALGEPFNFDAGAIRTDRGFVVKLARGVARLPCLALAVWRLP